MKVLYKPFGLIFSVLGGLVASRLFTRLWKSVSGEPDSPDARDRDRGFGEIVAAAALEGAVYGMAKAAADRAGAQTFQRLTGTWPKGKK